MKGVYGAGALIAFDELGYRQTFTTVSGISSGVPALAYFLSGGAHYIASLAKDESCSPEFLHPWDYKNTVNIDYFLHVLRGSSGKPIDFEKLLTSPTQLLIAVSEYATAKARLFSPTSAEQFLDMVAASISIPGVVSRKAYIDGVRYADGASTYPYAMDAMYDSVDATHVLVLMNQDKGIRRSSLLEYAINNTILRHRMSGPLLHAANRRHARRENFAEHLLATNQNAAVIWGDGSIVSYEKDSLKIERAIERSRQWWHELMA
ncbi:MAG: hypothetical protein RLZZ360_886 [Candidatus Parcubacteria bacterium]